MIQFDDRKEREQRASLCGADGLIDTGIGVGLVLLGFATMLGLGGIAGVYLAMLFPIVNASKRIVTMPRMHHLDFHPDPETGRRIGRVKAVASVSMGILIALGVLALFTTRMIPIPISKWLRANAIIVFGLLLAALFVILAWGLATKRFRAYAVVTTAALVFAHWFSLSPAWFFILLGAGVGGCGAAVLSRFVRDYPRMNGRDHFGNAKRYRFASGRIED